MMVVGVVLALLLAANLVVGLPTLADGGDPSGFLSPDILLRVGFWVPIGLAVPLCVAGMAWASKAYAETESSNLLWLRRGLGFGLAGVAAFCVATFEPEQFNRESLAVVAAWVIGVLVTHLSLAAWRAYRGSSSSGSGRGRRKRKSSSSSATDAMFLTGAHGSAGSSDGDA
jgi:hypothetical protein